MNMASIRNLPGCLNERRRKQLNIKNKTMDSLINTLIPENTKGKPTDVEHSITLDNREEALDTFKRAYKRMLNVNIWHKLSGFASADFYSGINKAMKLTGWRKWVITFRLIYLVPGLHQVMVTIGCR